MFLTQSRRGAEFYKLDKLSARFIFLSSEKGIWCKKTWSKAGWTCGYCIRLWIYVCSCLTIKASQSVLYWIVNIVPLYCVRKNTLLQRWCNRLIRCSLRRWRDHENCGSDESRMCAIEPSQTALTLRLCLKWCVLLSFTLTGCRHSPQTQNGSSSRHERTQKIRESV